MNFLSAKEARQISTKNKVGAVADINEKIKAAANQGNLYCQHSVTREMESFIGEIINELKASGYKVERERGSERGTGTWDYISIAW